MVKALHRAGIEVILDVVFNHTAEGDHDGPTLCFRGHRQPDLLHPRRRTASRYANYTGCGNTLNANHPVVRRHDRGQPALLGRARCTSTASASTSRRSCRATRSGTPLPNPPVLWDIESDPALAGTKLIAEAWDAAGLYQVGSFVGDAWKEWNGRFRDDVRGFFRGERRARCGASPTGSLGSPDLYGHKQREAEQSVNFVTCHDGFTLNDLVSYNQQAQRGQRRGQPRRRQRQPQLELRRRGADRRPGGREAAQPAGEELPDASRCCRSACR